MAITRKFFDWHLPALPAVVDYLAERFRRDATLDLDAVLLVLPGGRAGRRLTELLVGYCEAHQLLLRPPEYCTVGQLPEYLYESHRPFASELTQQLAWVRALQGVDRQRCVRFIPRLPAAGDFVGWMDLGGLLQRQHRELAADAIDFSQVAQRGAALAGFEDESRWAFLRRVQQDYLRLLDDLQLWDRQTARLYAIDHRLCRTDRQIILVGTTDMNIATRRMLDQVAEQVTALIHAPRTWADCFDEHGCLIPDSWTDMPLEIATDQIRVVAGPVDQAQEMVRCLAELDGRYRADEVVIGVLDESLIPQLTRQLEESGVASRWVVGRTVRETSPYKLLGAVASLLDRGRFRDFAALVRHAEVSQWLTDRVGTARWLIELDEYYHRHLPAQLGPWLGDPAHSALLQQAAALIQEALRPLRGAAQPLRQWAPAIAQLLAAFYGERTFRADDPQDSYTLRALQQLRESLLLYRETPDPIDPILTAAQAIAQTIAQVASMQIPSPRAGQQLELLGWLELPLDTAPAVIITGFNEGHVPTSVNSDLFLPNQLRQQLDLVDNRRRYARDAYALRALQASREHLVLIAGRFTADHDPLLPSRLAFATDDETMAVRARMFFQSPSPDEAPQAVVSISELDLNTGLAVPEPPPLSEPLTSLSVTSFRSYLECPYRFYLQHVLGLATMHDLSEELEAGPFGTLIHDVLKRFGRSQLRMAIDAQQIDPFLQSTLDRLVARQLGRDRLPAVDVQIAQARHRLRAFAHWQAQRAQDGWQIKYTETSGGRQPAQLTLADGRSVTLRGRIDRIDERDGQWAILDYKTGDTAKTPQETHLKGAQWIDLQLPLYIHLARTLKLKGTLQLGYILLPKDTDKVGASLAVWDDALLQTADQAALKVVADILDGIFWPPKNPAYFTDFAPICQEHAFRPRLENPGTNRPAKGG